MYMLGLSEKCTHTNHAVTSNKEHLTPFFLLSMHNSVSWLQRPSHLLDVDSSKILHMFDVLFKEHIQ